MYINKHMVNGNVGRDAVLRETAKGKVLSFSIANTSPYGDKDTTWYNVSLWGSKAESLEPYVKKGTKVVVDGETKLRKYTDKNGNERVELTIRAQDVQLEGRASASTESDEAGSADEEEDDNDLPF